MERHEGGRLVRVALVLVLGAFLIRLVHLGAMAAPANVLLDPAKLDMDPRWIHQQAIRVVEEGLFPTEPFPHSPAFCYLVAAVYAVGGSGAYPVVYVANALFGSLIPVVVLLITRRFTGEGAALAAAALSALYGPLLSATAFFLGDVLGALLACLVVLQMLRITEGASLRGAALLGLLLGAASLARPNSLLLSLMVTFVLLAHPGTGPVSRRFLLLTVTGLITLAMILPSTWSASRSQGRLEIICPTTEYNFIYANSETSTGYGSAYPAPGTPRLPLLSPARLEHELTKASYIWRFFEFPCIDNYYLYAELSPLIDWNPLTWRLVGPLALLGIALALRDRRRWAPLLWFILCAWIPLNLTLVYGRLRLVMAPVMMILAAHAGAWILAQRDPATRDRHRLAGWSFLLLAVIFVNSQDPTLYHGTFYADYSVGNARHSRALFRLDRAREAAAAGRAGLARELVAAAEEEVRANLGIASITYQSTALRLLADIARDFHHDPAREAELRARDEAIVASWLELPPADHEGNRFTPPTYRFWPRALGPVEASRDWLERERGRAPVR